jgi:hypothetical protein
MTIELTIVGEVLGVDVGLLEGLSDGFFVVGLIVVGDNTGDSDGSAVGLVVGVKLGVSAGSGFFEGDQVFTRIKLKQGTLNYERVQPSLDLPQLEMELVLLSVDLWGYYLLD